MRASARLLKRALSETDERSKLEGELVSGIEVVKCSAWGGARPTAPAAWHWSLIATDTLLCGRRVRRPHAYAC